MKAYRHIERAEADRLFSEREFYRLRLYLIELGFASFTACYEAPDLERAALLLPAALLPENEDAFARRLELRLATQAGEGLAGPFVLFEGAAGVAFVTNASDSNHAQAPGGEDDSATVVFAAASLERLLRAGEERVYVNDREGALEVSDLNEIAERAGIESERLFAELVADRLLRADGVVTTRQRRMLAELTAESAEHLSAGVRLCFSQSAPGPEQDPVDAMHAAHEGASPFEPALLRLRQTNPVLEYYDRPAGLFNFDRGGVNFTAHLGRGEHNVFFEYLIGNRYGHFMPYSFTDAARSPELSLEIYRELVRRAILDDRGRLADIRRLDRLDCLADHQTADSAGIKPGAGELPAAGPATPSESIVLEAVRAVLGAARPLGIEDMRRDLKYQRDAIESDLADPGILKDTRSFDGTPLDFDAVRRAVADAGHADHPRFVAAYQESRIHQEINHEAAKNRGVVLTTNPDEAQAAWLLLLTDDILISAPYYAFLLADFRERFGVARTGSSRAIRIAHAYHAPTPRNPRKFPHPIVHALQMMERETPSDLKEIRDLARDSDHESDASS